MFSEGPDESEVQKNHTVIHNFLNLRQPVMRNIVIGRNLDNFFDSGFDLFVLGRINKVQKIRVWKRILFLTDL